MNTQIIMTIITLRSSRVLYIKTWEERVISTKYHVVYGFFLSDALDPVLS